MHDGTQLAAQKVVRSTHLREVAIARIENHLDPLLGKRCVLIAFICHNKINIGIT